MSNCRCQVCFGPPCS